MQFALFLIALLWYFGAEMLAASAARGMGFRFDLGESRPLLEALFFLFLLVIGFALLRGIERRRAPLRLTLGLPRRSTMGEEWVTGAVIGWGISVGTVLPMAIARTLNVRLWMTPHAFYLLAVGLLTLAIVTLTHVVGIYGYGFQRLIEAIGPVRATVAIAALSGIRMGLNPESARAPVATCIVVTLAASVLFSVCWLRTHGLWLMWGLRFAWSASTAALFGLPLSGNTAYSSVVETRTLGRAWLTGGSFGPGAAALSAFVVIAGIVVVVLATSDYAWEYTHPPLIPAGYDVTIPPPAAHAAMEEAAAQKPVNPASLVQILPAAPQVPPSDKAAE